VRSGQDKKDVFAKKKQSQAKVTQRETMAFSILYNNALFLLSVVVLGFFVFKSAPGPLYTLASIRFIYCATLSLLPPLACSNYVISVSLSAAALSFFSASAL